jgi:glycosyltransferase involved in cell wall biosynthesis
MGEVLSVVVPAYNEEASIREISERCLKARGPIRQETGLSDVEVIVVDDGSRDRTREIVSAIDGVRVIVHPVNQGYGRALMTGFEAAKGDFLAFLDADGTCDPLAFIPLVKALREKKAAMAVGNRMHGESQMPAVRAIGNRLYAWLLSGLTGTPIQDTASGMRVFTRRLLDEIKPLPTGLHFTPAMTAKVACLGRGIAEVPIPYAERQGRSKLNVIADGMRFLRVILGIVFAYYPLRIFGPLGLLFAGIALGYAYYPVTYYLEHRRLEPEDMIYRLLTIVTLMVCGFIALTYGAVAQRVSNISLRRDEGPLTSPWLPELSIGAGVLLAMGGVILNSRTILEYVSSGRISIHWIYVLTGSLAVILGTVLVSFGITMGLAGHLPNART